MKKNRSRKSRGTVPLSPQNVKKLFYLHITDIRIMNPVFHSNKEWRQEQQQYCCCCYYALVPRIIPNPCNDDLQKQSPTLFNAGQAGPNYSFFLIKNHRFGKKSFLIWIRISERCKATFLPMRQVYFVQGYERKHSCWL
jgi:hypothetical protein